MPNRSKQVKTFIEGNVIGTLYLAATGDAYLHYCYTQSQHQIDMENAGTFHLVKVVLKQAQDYCKEHVYDLISY